MANISVRSLDPDVHAALRRRAARDGRSMEAEVRAILTDAVRNTEPANPFLRLIDRAAAAGGVDLQLPAPEFETRADADDTFRFS